MSRVPKATQDAASRSPVARRECIVSRAKSRPVRGDRVGSRSTGDVLGHDSSESGVEVEVDVAVEEPGARVVCLNARNLISLIRFMREGKRDVP